LSYRGAETEINLEFLAWFQGKSQFVKIGQQRTDSPRSPQEIISHAVGPCGRLVAGSRFLYIKLFFIRNGRIMNKESIRQSYRPKSIRFLLVGESPPASGKFFYIRSAMTIYTARAFEKAHSKSFNDTQEFLNYFKKCGCYLDDLSHAPVDDLDGAKREACLNGSIDGLSDRIREMNPSALAIALRKIESHVREAVRRSGKRPIIAVLPYAGNGHQVKYIKEMTKLIRKYIPERKQL